MRKKDEAMKLALEALEGADWYINQLEMIVYSADDAGTHENRLKVQQAITVMRLEIDAKNMASTAAKPDFWEGYVPEPDKRQQALDKMAENARELGLDYEPVWNNLPSNKDVEDAMRLKRLSRLAEQPAQQEPVAWKLVPREPTHEMLKAMDECSTEGYDERLYAGHASSVYMAAVDAAPTPPAQRKPLTDEEIILIVAECAASHQHTDIHFARAIERAHGIKEKNNG